MTKNVKTVNSYAREIIEVKSKVCVLEAYNACRRVAWNVEQYY